MSGQVHRDSMDQEKGMEVNRACSRCFSNQVGHVGECAGWGSHTVSGMAWQSCVGSGRMHWDSFLPIPSSIPSSLLYKISFCILIYILETRHKLWNGLHE